MRNSSLTVVGSGIKFFSHLTIETISYIRNSQQVLYLVNDPAMKEWIEKNNPNSQSLDFLYRKYRLRIHNYEAITNYIVEQSKRCHVCVVMYGHPVVFAQPALNAVIKLQQEGHDAVILPGISAEDCLLADLLVDVSVGIQSFEATDFLIHRRRWDPSSNLLLWQIGVMGIMGNSEFFESSNGIQLLYNYLSSYYKTNHEIILYVASQYPGIPAQIQRFPLDRLLTNIEIPRLATMYIKPALNAPIDKEAVKSLKISLDELL